MSPPSATSSPRHHAPLAKLLSVTLWFLLPLTTPGCTLLAAMGVGLDTIPSVTAKWRVTAQTIPLYDKDEKSEHALAVRLLSGPLPTGNHWNPTPAEQAEFREKQRPILLNANYRPIDPAAIPPGVELEITGTMSQRGESIWSDHRTLLTRTPSPSPRSECTIVATEIRRATDRHELLWHGPKPDH